MFVIAVPLLLIAAACTHHLNGYASILAFMGFRIFPVLVVHIFKLTLDFKISEDRRLQERYLQAKAELMQDRMNNSH